MRPTCPSRDIPIHSLQPMSDNALLVRQPRLPNEMLSLVGAGTPG